MATTAADATRARHERFGWAGAGLCAAGALWILIESCAPAGAPVAPAPAPVPERPAPTGSAEPEIRVGLAVGASTGTLGGGSELVVTDPSGAYMARIAAGEIWRLAITGSGLAVVSPMGGSSVSSSQLGVIPLDSGAPVIVNGRPYRGDLAVLRDRTGLTIINRLPLEDYLQGVVSAEMGRRSASEQEALRAQAIVSRTYALRNLRRWNVNGFDLYSTVADQAYGGMGSETPEGAEAVAATRGQILTWDGAPIDAFFYSTCGGRTAQGTEVFRAASRPYLRSVDDVADDGVAYCSISPRFRWHEEWSGEALRSILRRTLPVAIGTPPGQVGQIRDVRVTALSGSGRVERLTIALDGATVDVDEPQVRAVLRSPSGDLLRSNTFTLTATGAGRRITRLVADGSGAGHGVGFCQWGAVGRSRAGQDYQRIVMAYYPGTVLERLY